MRTTPDLIGKLLGQYAPTAAFEVAAALPTGTVGLVCEGLFCREPAKDWETLPSQLERSQQQGNNP